MNKIKLNVSINHQAVDTNSQCFMDENRGVQTFSYYCNPFNGIVILVSSLWSAMDLFYAEFLQMLGCCCEDNVLFL